MVFKVGDKVKILKKAMYFFLTEEGIACYDVSSRQLTLEEKRDREKMIITSMILLMDNSYPAIVLEHSHPGTDAENYKVNVLGWEVRIDKDHVKRYRES